MKGIVFTEFLDLVDDVFGMEMAEQIIDDCNLPSGGVYTTVGTYDHEEIVALVKALSQRSQISVDELLRIYGNHLFKRFAVLFPEQFAPFATSLDFLAGVHEIIHTEVLKLYPDATLPQIPATRDGEHCLKLHYSSPRKMEDLAQGLIEGCIEHFGEDVEITSESIATAEGQNTVTLFTLIRTP